MTMCNSDLFVHFFMIFLVVFIYDQIKSLFYSKKEGFDATTDVIAAINKVYNADIEAIRNLSSIAQKLLAGGLTVPGNLLLPSGGELDLGSNDTTRETNAGKIVYGKFETDSLGIVGKGNLGGNRKIKMWDNVEIATNLNVGNTLSAGNIFTNSINTNTNPIYFWAPGDPNHFIGHSQGTRKWNNGSPNGPAVVGWDGGSLGSTNGGDKTALTWDKNGNVNINGNLNIKGTIILGDWTINGLDGHLRFFNKSGTQFVIHSDTHIYSTFHNWLPVFPK